ncbi:hypothetical protein BKA64DRAFT_694093 [Cadophora sp. MPI-SDFR-AT-0126]|nr:hypothetical protein BKA64DRAFT_694093 [Leotiomycetes sp. MPI-SDFR-AT-0126]
MEANFDYLVRFVNEHGVIKYGNLPYFKDDAVGSQAEVLTGDPIAGFFKTGRTEKIHKLLCPLASTPIIQCIGINYHKHAHETNFSVPSQPVVFTKPSDSMTGPFNDIYVHPDAREQLDYEGELCFVFGKDCKDPTEEEALSYILAYATGNDVSARNYIPQEVSGFQMGYGKSFDDFGPLGPYLVSPAIVGDPHRLKLVTKVNGEVRQDANTSDMIWSIRQIIVHLARGRTVRAGTVVMTGTPSGVGWFMNPTGYVKEGDIMEVTIEKLGTMRNRIVFS